MLIQPQFKQALVLITNRCNISCKHCYVASSPYGEYGIPRERLLRLVDELCELQGPIELAISGGEPLARARDALDMMEHAAGRMELLLLTNGILITPEIASQLNRLNARVRVSVDGHNADVHDWMRGAGSYTRMRRGVARLLESGFPPGRLEMYATLPDNHLDEISTILELAESWGIERLKFEPVARTGRALDTWGHAPSSAEDPDTQKFRRLFDRAGEDLTRGNWKFRDIEDTSFDVLNIYSNGEVFPFTWQDENDRTVGLLGNMLRQSLHEVLAATTVSNAIIGKFAMMAAGPPRSLRAIRATRASLSTHAVGE
jgi:MoaA/NifB/PqqE/SkfB family radical SAM enzyme